MDEVYTSLLSKLRHARNLKEFHVVCMPDFFLDYFISLPRWEKVIPQLKEIHDRGGGNLPGLKLTLSQGGNATNTALALAKLGISTHIVGRTSSLGYKLMCHFLESDGVDLKHVKTDGKLDKTVSLEFGEKRINVMLNELGSVQNFDFTDLNKDDLELISSSDLVFVTNWTLNDRGTSLAQKTFRYAKEHDVITYFDSGDPSHRIRELPVLYARVLSSSNLDVLSVNENELRHFASAKGIKGNPTNMAKQLSIHINAILDVHTSRFSSSWRKGEAHHAPVFKVELKRSTGAGDAWNAANMLGYLLGLEPEERLTFANAFAAGYLNADEPRHLTLKETVTFLKRAEPV